MSEAPAAVLLLRTWTQQAQMLQKKTSGGVLVDRDVETGQAVHVHISRQ